jgi:hypothetical protein
MLRVGPRQPVVHRRTCPRLHARPEIPSTTVGSRIARLKPLGLERQRDGCLQLSLTAPPTHGHGPTNTWQSRSDRRRNAARRDDTLHGMLCVRGRVLGGVATAVRIRTGGRRPIIVVSHDSFNHGPGWRSVIVVALSRSGAQARHGPTAVPVAAAHSGLPEDSVALCHQ